MKKITIKGKDYELRNKASEVTLNELAEIAHILNGKEGDFTDKWLQVLAILGSKEIVEFISMKQFSEAVKSVQITNVTSKIQKTIEVNGRTYSIAMDGKEIDLSAKDLSKIEAMTQTKKPWGHKAVALVYKDDALSDIEHYADAHINFKAELFGKEVKADVGAPVIYQLGLLIVEHVKSLSDAQSVAV